MKEVAPTNMWNILVTEDTSQSEMSPLKEVGVVEHAERMLVTDETSQSDMSPLKDEAP